MPSKAISGRSVSGWELVKVFQIKQQCSSEVSGVARSVKKLNAILPLDLCYQQEMYANVQAE